MSFQLSILCLVAGSFPLLLILLINQLSYPMIIVIALLLIALIQPVDQKRQRRIADLRQGKFHWIAVDFPADPGWDLDLSYTSQCKQYHSLYKSLMPMVPSLMTHCELDETPGESPSDTVQISYRSMVLEPQKWILHIEPDGDPINGSEDAGRPEINHEETIQFTNSFEFSSEVGVSGGSGTTRSSVDLMSHTKVTWDKKVLINQRQVVLPEQGCGYQPIVLYAKLLCKVVHAREGKFSIDFTKGLNVTSPIESVRFFPDPKYHSARTAEHQDKLYEACGKCLTATRLQYRALMARAPVVRVQAVADPLDAMLCIRCSGTPEQVGLWRPEEVRWPAFRGLPGFTLEIKEREMTYSPGNMVKVWKVIVKAKV